MPPYDPQRARNRPVPRAEGPAPVDEILDASITKLPTGVDIEVTPGGETIVHTSDADIAITSSGDEVIVATRDARVEVRAETDEVIVEAADEEIFIDTTPRVFREGAQRPNGPIVRTSDDGRSKLIIVVAAAIVVVLAVLVLGRKRRS